MSRSPANLRLRGRPALVWALAALTAVLSLGNGSGVVLCIEDDGSMAIESPVEQAACHHRHKQAADRAAKEGVEVEAAGGCVDIPLCVAANAIAHRHVSPRTVARDIQAIAVPYIAGGQMPVVAVDRSSGAGQPNRSFPPALAALRTVVLLV